MTLFTIRITLASESHHIDYDSVDAALHDSALASLLAAGAVVSVWCGNLRVTRDLTTWDTLRSQIVNNATTLLRGVP